MSSQEKCKRYFHRCQSWDSQCHPNREFLRRPLRISCYIREVRAPLAEEDRQGSRSRPVLLRSRLDCRRSCQHVGGSDRSLRWSSMEHREDSHSPCYRSPPLSLHPKPPPPGTLAQTRLARSSPGPSPGTVTREGRSEVIISYHNIYNLYLTAQNKHSYPQSPHHVASLSNSSETRLLDKEIRFITGRTGYGIRFLVTIMVLR